MPERKKRKASKFIIGAGVATAVAAGVVGFLTQTKQGQKLAKKGRDYAEDITTKVTKEAEKAAKLTKGRYEEIIDEILAEYKKGKKVTAGAAEELGDELKKQWKRIQREMKK